MDVGKASKLLQVGSVSSCPSHQQAGSPMTCAGWHRAGHLPAALRGAHPLSASVQGACSPPLQIQQELRWRLTSPWGLPQIDFNLYGMGAVRMSKVKFRPPVPDAHAPHRPGWRQAPVLLSIEPELQSAPQLELHQLNPGSGSTRRRSSSWWTCSSDVCALHSQQRCPEAVRQSAGQSC